MEEYGDKMAEKTNIICSIRQELRHLPRKKSTKQISVGMNTMSPKAILGHLLSLYVRRLTWIRLSLSISLLCPNVTRMHLKIFTLKTTGPSHENIVSGLFFNLVNFHA